MPAVGVFVAWPHRLRTLVLLTTVVLCSLTVVGWFALPRDIRELFTVSQLLTLLGVLALLVGVTVAVAASSVRADETGLQIRNGLRTHQVPWTCVHKIIFRKGDPWAQLLLLPADGGEFEVDLDAEKRQLMGIQAVDGIRAQRAVEELRRRHRVSQGSG
ncbi:MAG TPA: PH domain-containing protein [Propionibacteriaceae bacterium]|nr:PH domain-containing protein [Propionibacteriaceae bacterium]